MRKVRIVSLLAGGVLAALLCAELGLRLFVMPGYWRPLPPFRAVMTRSQQAWLERKQQELSGERPPSGIGTFDPVLGWSYRPGSRTGDGLYSIHAGGWRGARDYPLPVAPGITRLAAFGESFTFCNEVGDDASWEAQLEALDPSLEVVNMGVGGYGTDQALLRAERELSRLGAELVLVGLLPENIGRNLARFRPLWAPQSESPVAKPRFVLQGGELLLVPLPFRDEADYVRALASGEVLERLSDHEYWNDDALPAALRWSALVRLYAGRRAYRSRDIPLLWSQPGEPRDTMLAILARFRELARAHGARDAVVLVFPADLDLTGLVQDGEKYWTTLLEALERADAPHLDLSDALAEAGRAEGIESLYTDRHFSRKANGIVARALLEWLRTP